MDTLIVSERFGPTFQGEGPSAGRRALFLRLGLCNLDCAWCDTPYTWDWQGKIGPKQDRSLLLRNELDDIAAWVANAFDMLDTRLLVITGGEPLLQRRGLERLMPLVASPDFDIEIETNGTIDPGRLLARYCSFNVSPKLAHANTSHEAIVPDVLEALVAYGARFKFVVRDLDDLAEIGRLVHDHGIPFASVWVMPEGRSAETIQARSRTIADAALASGYNFSTRLHVLLWGDERGR